MKELKTHKSLESLSNELFKTEIITNLNSIKGGELPCGPVWTIVAGGWIQDGWADAE